MLSPRKHKISRLEEFSDAVFGFALTLLVITTSVPRSYADLLNLLQGIPSFACCFALLVWIWYEHDAFFDRYPVDDGRTVILNSLLLFSVLLYIYPLKFMFDSFMQVFGFQQNPPITPMTLDQLAKASSLYGLGYFILMSLFALLYMNALRQRERLGLDAMEAFDTRAQASHHWLSASVGLFAMGFALFGPRRLAFLSPASFALLGPAHAILGAINGKRRARMAARSAVAAPIHTS